MIKGILFKGFATTISLISAIGAQNTFLLRQGLLKQHVFLVCTVCFICDVFLISLGIFGVDYVVTSPFLENCITFGGALFLFVYGGFAFRSAWVGNSKLQLDPNNLPARTMGQITLVTLAVTLLNPHAFLDTVVILGGICVPMTLDEKWIFLMGALIGSFIWFYSVGFGARLLIPWFRSSKTWRFFDTFTGCVMWGIAVTLLKGLL